MAARYEVSPAHGEKGWWIVIDHNSEQPADDDEGRTRWRTKTEAACLAKRLNAEKGGPDRW